MDTTEQGCIVQTRWRYSDYLDEPNDIIYESQPYGYVNAKQRPVLVLGVVGNDVIAAPLKTKQHPDGNLKYGAKKAIDAGLAYEPSQIAAGNKTHNGGTIIDVSEIRRIPITEFSFRELLDPKTNTAQKYPDSTINDVCKLAGIRRPLSTGKIHSRPLNQNKRIHNEDLQVRYEAALKTLHKSKNSKIKRNAKLQVQMLKQEKRNCFTRTDNEKEAHHEARELGLTRQEMSLAVLSDGLNDLSSQDDIQL